MCSLYQFVDQYKLSIIAKPSSLQTVTVFKVKNKWVDKPSAICLVIKTGASERRANLDTQTDERTSEQPLLNLRKKKKHFKKKQFLLLFRLK